MADSANEEIFVSDVVDKEEGAMVLVSADTEDEFLSVNDIPTGFLEDEEYGTLSNIEGGVYTYVKNEEDAAGNNVQTLTIVDCNKQEIIRWGKNNEGDYVATVYTTNGETTGYSVNTTALGMGLSLDGTLKDPTLGVGVALDPLQLRDAYNGNSSDTFEKDDVSSTAAFVDNFGETALLADSFNKYASDGSIEEVQIFKNTFDDYVFGAGISYNGNEPQTFTEFYEFDQQYDVFGNLSNNFSNSIIQTHESNSEAWGNIDTCLNGILETYKDAFKIGNLDISVVAETIKESLKDAKTKIETYLDEVSDEYSRVSGVKKAILAELAELEAANSEEDETVGGGGGGR